MPSRFEADLVALLLGDASIAAAIADQAANENRIYPLERPADQANLRALVYTVVNADALDLDGHGAEGGEDVHLQLDVWAASHDEARELALLVMARLEQGSTAIATLKVSRSSEKDPDTREACEVLDCSIVHSPQ